MTLVVDSSALLAMLLDEPGADDIELVLAESDPIVIGAPTFVEAAIVVEARLGPAGRLALDRAVRIAGVAVVPLDHEMAEEAVDGWRRFGKGRHAAGLNLGDCYTYGLARSLGSPVLCVGEDFALTDIDVFPLASI